jgi:hypothetical protein
MRVRFRRRVLPFLILIIAASVAPPPAIADTVPGRATALGIDVGFYTGPISADTWLRIRQGGQSFVIAQAWGGRSRNEFAESQLAGARAVGMRTAAYVLLNYDDRVCPSFAQPVRDFGGSCFGDPIAQAQPGGRWQVRQGFAALGRELADVSFVAIDVEWFMGGSPPSDLESRQRRRQSILDAIDEVVAWRKRPVIYTRNGPRHWLDITGCSNNTPSPECDALYAVVRHPLRPVPLWDVEVGEPALDGFQPHGPWTSRIGRQYGIDEAVAGLPEDMSVDLNVFDLAIFSTPSLRNR